MAEAVAWAIGLTVGVAAVNEISDKSEATPSDKPAQGAKPKATVDDLKKAGTQGRETKGRASQTDMPGDRDSGEDFDALGGSESQTTSSGVEVKELSGGEIAVHRPETKTRGATIEVQTKNDKGKVVKVEKLRYPKRQ